MKKHLTIAMAACAMVLAFSACSGKSDRDGFKSLEGPADPANDGGRLGGDHAAPVSDSATVKDTVKR